MKRKVTLKNLIFLVIAIIFIVAFIRQQETIKRIEKDKQAKQVELQELKESNERLQEENNEAQSDGYIEKLARERLNMIKPGETSVEIKKIDPKS